MPVSHHSVFNTGWMPFLLPNQQRQGTEDTYSAYKLVGTHLPFMEGERQSQHSFLMFRCVIKKYFNDGSILFS